MAGDSLMTVVPGSSVMKSAHEPLSGDPSVVGRLTP